MIHRFAPAVLLGLCSACQTPVEISERHGSALSFLMRDMQHRLLLDSPVGVRMRARTGFSIEIDPDLLGVPPSTPRVHRSRPIATLVPDEPGWLGPLFEAQGRCPGSGPTLFETADLVRVDTLEPGRSGWTFTDVPAGRYDLIARWRLTSGGRFESRVAHAAVEVDEGGELIVRPSERVPEEKAIGAPREGSPWARSDFIYATLDRVLIDIERRALLDSAASADLRTYAGFTFALEPSKLRGGPFLAGQVAPGSSVWLVPDRPGWRRVLDSTLWMEDPRDAYPELARLIRKGTLTEEGWTFENVPSGAYDLIAVAPGERGRRGSTAAYASVEVSEAGEFSTWSGLMPHLKSDWVGVH